MGSNASTNVFDWIPLILLPSTRRLKMKPRVIDTVVEKDTRSDPL